MSAQTLSQRLRDLRHGLFYEEQTVNAVLDDCIAQAEAMEGQAIGEQTPVAWIIPSVFVGINKQVTLDPDVASAVRTNGGIAEPLYRSPISPEARDRAIKESVRRAVYEWMATQMDEGDTADTLLAEIGVNADAAEVDADLCKRLDQALSALRGS